MYLLKKKKYCYKSSIKKTPPQRVIIFLILTQIKKVIDELEKKIKIKCLTKNNKFHLKGVFFKKREKILIYI